MKYYSLDRILAKNCDYNFIFSGRGPGKSTAMVNHLIDEFFQNDAEFVRIGRYDWEVSRTLMSNWFNTVNYRKLIDYTNNDEVLVKFEGGQWRLYEDAKHYRTMGYMVTLNNQDVFKSVSYDGVTNIVYEEFAMLNQRDYMVGEVEAYLSAVSTIARSRQNVKAWFIGNTLDKHNPFFELFGIDIDRLGIQPGEIRTFQCAGFDGLGATVAVEYAEMAYEDVIEMSPLMRISGNDTATTGTYILSEEVTDYERRTMLVPPSGWVHAVPGVEGIYIGGGQFASAYVSRRPIVDGRHILQLCTYRGERPPYMCRWLNVSGLTMPWWQPDLPGAERRVLKVVDPSVMLSTPQGRSDAKRFAQMCRTTYNAFELDEYRHYWYSLLDTMSQERR